MLQNKANPNDLGTKLYPVGKIQPLLTDFVKNRDEVGRDMKGSGQAHHCNLCAWGRERKDVENGSKEPEIRRKTPPGASSWPNSMRRRSQPRRHTNFRAKYSKCVCWCVGGKGGLEGSENSLATNYLSFWGSGMAKCRNQMQWLKSRLDQQCWFDLYRKVQFSSWSARGG